MISPSPAGLVVALVLLLVGIASTGPEACANMADPLQPGAALGEPTGSLERMTVERERLEIDLRALALEPESGEDDGMRRALVSARYQILNDSAERPLVLEFYAQSLDTSQWTVRIDGRPVAARFRIIDAAASPYPPPATTPGPDGGALDYAASVTGILRFDATVGPGRHVIQVEYVAEVTRHVVDHPLVHWQLGYILSPARRWPSFGRLEIVVLAPDDWSVATAPELEHVGEIYRGTFEGIPADALAITARARYQAWYSALTWLPSVLALLVGGYGAIRAGRALGLGLGRKERSAAWAVPSALGAGIVLAFGSLAAGLFGTWLREGLVGAGQTASSYGWIFLQVVLLVVAFLVGVAAMQLSAVAALRRARRRYDARWIDAYDAPDERAVGAAAGVPVADRQG